jgi:geranylgeranyl reductase family protein
LGSGIVPPRRRTYHTPRSAGGALAEEHFDVLVVGAGPAGSIAALVLARGGARVAVVDKATFPRDKACGDLVGPRGVQLLDDLELAVPGAIPIGDMIVVGPSGRRVRLPCAPGRSYPGHGLAVPRSSFDAGLHAAAVVAGATPVVGQAVDLLRGPNGIEGVALAGGARLRADVVIGADGATSRVAEAAGLVDHGRVMWGFALRAYADQAVELPAIVLWEPTRWRALPGYGWMFPGPDGRANIGLGVGTLADRGGGSEAVRQLPGFLDHLQRLDLLRPGPRPAGRLGGWLKMGMVGTTPAAGRVLLVGDAAGLVNPLQGEGIAQAMRSGHAAADAILAAGGDPRRAGERHLAWLAAEHLPYQGIAAAMQSVLLPHPTAIAAVGRMVSLPAVGRALAPGWSVFWNELLDGAAPGRGRTTAALATRVGHAAAARTRTWKWLDRTFNEVVTR